MKPYIVRIVLGLAVTLFFILHALGIFHLRFLQQLENISYDTRLKLTMPQTVDTRVVIIDIDEKSLAEVGRWPWGRDRVGAMMDALFDYYKVSIVGFDVVFAERDESSGLKVLEQLAQKQLKGVAPFQSALHQLRPQLDHDRRFAEGMKGRPIVLGYYFNPKGAEASTRTSGALPPPVFPAGAFKDRDDDFQHAAGYGANLPEFQNNAASAGHFNVVPDVDGVIRSVPMLMEYQGAYYESLSLAMMRTLMGQPRLEAVFPGESQGADLEWLRLKNLEIPVDSGASALIPYRGPQGSFKYVSASDVLNKRVKSSDLNGAIVLVGTTAPGLKDLRSTPVGTAYPGVEIHANLIANMLDRRLMERPPYVLAVELLTLLVMGLLLSVLLALQSPVKALLTTLLMLLLSVALNLWVWHTNLVLPLASSLLLILTLFVLNMSYGFFVESRAKRQITGLFGQYVAPELVGEMCQNPGSFAAMEGESREMTVLFSDIRDFTSISEGLEPKQLTQLMNEYLTPMTHVIHKHRGTIDKYMGDAIMAFWGAPLSDPEHARHALLAGMEMQAELASLQQHFKTKGWPEIHIGVGINTGPMNVGNMGSQFRVAYTVLGDTVNLASRVEGLTKQYGVKTIVGEATMRAVPDMVYRELDKVRVKGKDIPVAIHEPLGAVGQVEQAVLDALELFRQVLKLYRAQDWDIAEMQLLNLQKNDPDCLLYRIYLERIAFFRANPPPPDWDGVFIFETK